MNLYLSKITINTGGDPNKPRPGRMWIHNPYRVHQRLCMAFPDHPHDDKEDPKSSHVNRNPIHSVLFRIDGIAPKIVLVQSTMPPDWDSAFGNAPFLLKRPPETKVFVPVLEPGVRYQFLLRANPTVKKQVADGNGGRKGKRFAIKDSAEQAEWFARKAESAGFRPLQLEILKDRPQRSRRSRQIDPKPHTHWSVDFTGILEVLDAGRFRDALVSGIGPAKAYGFGLLSIAR